METQFKALHEWHCNLLTGHVGIVKDATDSTVRVELHSKCQTIIVDRSRVSVVGSTSAKAGSFTSYTRTPTWGGSATPMYGNTGSRTPMYGSQTPQYDGSRTPHYGSMTPSHDGSATPGRCVFFISCSFDTRGYRGPKICVALKSRSEYR